MKVNFNNLRRQAVLTLRDLTEDFNNNIIKDSQYAIVNGSYRNESSDIKGYVLIDSEDIEDKMNNLIGLMNSIASVYEEDNDDFKDLTDELTDDLVWFNDTDED